MKKHIKRKFLFDVELPEDVASFLDEKKVAINWSEKGKVQKIGKDMVGYVITEERRMIKTFRYNHQDEILWIPEPDTVLIYFHSAYMNYRTIKERRVEIIKQIKEMKYTEEVQHALYEFFSVTSGFIIFLFTSVEAFINHSIPQDYIYRKSDRRKTEEYTKEQIERYIGIDEKLNEVLADVHKKSFKKSHPLVNKHIENLKDFRDSIIHTKAVVNENTSFDYLFKKSITFKYEETINAVRDFLNFYKPGYVEDCSCNNNW